MTSSSIRTEWSGTRISANSSSRKLDPEDRQGDRLSRFLCKSPDHPKGTLDLELDEDGDIWVGLMYQTGLARFDRATETFRIYPIPKEWQPDATQQSHFSVAASKVDGKAWVKNSDRSQIMRLDLATGEYENLGTFRNPKNDRPIGIYGIYADQQNNVYILEFPPAGSARSTPRPASFRSIRRRPLLPGRGAAGSITQNRLWFAEFGGNAVGMFDPETEKITEWKKPLPWEAPYDVVADRNGEAWEVNETSDRVGRLDPRTGESPIICCRATATSAACSWTTVHAR